MLLHEPANVRQETDEARRDVASLPRAAVLLIDDGELAEVREVLADLGIESVRLRGSAHMRGWRQPRDLLIVTARHALTLSRPVAQESDSFSKIVLFDEESRTLRSQLEAMGFDHLVLRPVHTQVIHDLIQQTLHRDAEQRAEHRVPIGREVLWQAGWRRRTATLTEISRRGCSLHVTGASERGGKIAIEIPGAGPGAESLRLSGRVARFRSDPTGDDDERAALSVLFDDLPPVTRASLAVLMKRHATRPSAPAR